MTIHTLKTLMNRLGLTCLATCAGGMGSLSAEEFQPWHALDEEVVAAFHLPANPQVSEAYAQSRLSTLINVEDIFARVIAFMREEDPDAHTEMMTQLTAVGLEPQDLLSALSGAMGAALALRPGQDSNDEPQAQGIFWLTPGAELNDRLMRALGLAIEMQEGPPEQHITRWDHDVAGTRVIELRPPSIHSVSEVGDDGSVTVVEQPVGGPQTSMLLVHDGDRLLLSLQQVEADGDSAHDQQRLVQFAQRVQGEQANAFGERVLSSPSLANHLFNGPLQYEAYADIGAILKLAPNEQPAFGPSPQEVFAALGLNELGLVGMRSVLNGLRLQGSVFIEVPGPRRGIPALFEQKPVNVDIPNWIPLEVVEAQLISWDLSLTYHHIREMAIALMGDVAREQFAQFDQGAAATLGMDIASICAALGDQHQVVTFPAADDQPALDPDGAWFDEMEDDTRVAWVSNIRNPQAVEALVNTLGNLAGTFSNVDLAQEQGFDGWRIAVPGFTMGLFHGQGYMVLGVGEGISEMTLSLLNHPPPAESRLNNDPQALRLVGELPERPALLRTYQDLGRALAEVRQMFTQLEHMLRMHGDGDAGAQFMLGLIPSADDIRESFGNTANQLWSDEQGIGLHLIHDLPER